MGDKKIPYNYIVAKDEYASLATIANHFKITHFFSAAEKRILPVSSDAFLEMQKNFIQFVLKSYYVKGHLLGKNWTVYTITMADDEELEDSCFYVLLRDDQRRDESFPVDAKNIEKLLSP